MSLLGELRTILICTASEGDGARGARIAAVDSFSAPDDLAQMTCMVMPWALRVQGSVVGTNAANIPKVFWQHGLMTNLSGRASNATFTRVEHAQVFQEEPRNSLDITAVVDTTSGAPVVTNVRGTAANDTHRTA